MSMKNILINAIGDKNWIGGLYYAKNIAFVLSCNDYIKTNHKVYIYTNAINREFFSEVPTNTKMIYSSHINSKIQKIEKAYTYITHGIKYLYMGTKEMSQFGITTIRWIPDFQHAHYPALFDKTMIEERNKRYSSYAESNVPLVLSSNDSLSDLKHFYHIKNDHIKVVPFVSWIEPEIRDISEEFEKKLLETKQLIKNQYAVIMNQFWQHKNHIVVLRAIKEYFRIHSESSFCFVFTGKMEDYRNPDYINQVKKIAADPNVASHMKILGFIDRKEQLALMKNAAFVIQPSLFEGWGTVVEDAKVLDKTILLSDIPVHHEQMNEKCIMFDPYDPIALANLFDEECGKEHRDDINKGITDMYYRAKEYSKGFEQLFRDLEKK